MSTATLAALREAAKARGLALPPGDDDDLALTLDSFARVELIELVEERCQIRVRPRDATAENFGTLAAIARFVDAQRGKLGSSS